MRKLFLEERRTLFLEELRAPILKEVRNGNFFKELRGRKDWDGIDRALLEELFEVWFEGVWGNERPKAH